jgi:hypothetical protein
VGLDGSTKKSTLRIGPTISQPENYSTRASTLQTVKLTTEICEDDETGLPEDADRKLHAREGDDDCTILVYSSNCRPPLLQPFRHTAKRLAELMVGMLSSTDERANKLLLDTR